MKNKWQTILVVAALVFIFGSAVSAKTCPYCQAQDISALAMVCPDCRADLHDPTLSYNAQKKASLKISLYYTGDNPDRMPPYGKVYINGEYMGNVPMIEKEIIAEDFSQTWSDGLGKEFTAFYEKSFSNIPAGILKVEIEMKFDRFYGLGRSFKKVTFPYIAFRPGENTLVKHYFNSAVNFSKFDPPAKKPLPVISEMKLQGASGTVALNVGLFD
jgi:hypothetical protein